MVSRRRISEVAQTSGVIGGGVMGIPSLHRQIGRLDVGDLRSMFLFLYHPFRLINCILSGGYLTVVTALVSSINVL